MSTPPQHTVDAAGEMVDIKSLVARVLGGNVDALDDVMAIVDTIARHVEFDAPQMSLDTSDVIQETKLKVWRKLETFSGSTEEEFRAWVTTISKRTAADRVRFYGRQRRDATRTVSLPEDSHGQVMLDGDATTPSGAAIRREEQEKSDVALSQLGEDDQTIIRRKFYDGQDWQTIAEEIGRSVVATRKLYYRAIDRWNRRRAITSGE